MKLFNKNFLNCICNYGLNQDFFRRIELINADLEDVSKRFEFYIQGITPRISFSGTVGYKLESNNYPIRGVGPSHKNNEMTIMMKGRFINGLDVDNKERNVVIGRLVEQDLFKDDDAIGKFISESPLIVL